MNQSNGQYKAVIIAADQYRNFDNLPNTVNDATEIKRLLTEEPTFFTTENVQYIHGNLASKHILSASLTSFFNQADSEDVLFLYWAGHGGGLNGEGYFIPYDADRLPSTLIPMQDIRDLIENTKAKTVIALFDTCHSGAITRSSSTMLARGIEVKGEGKVLIAACLPDQSAWDRNGHGAFTDHLIHGLQGGAANSNGEIDIYTLYSYLSRQLTAEFVDGSQIPLMKSTISGAPITLKRIASRNLSNQVSLKSSEVITTSGNYFLLGQLLVAYDEYKETDSEIQLSVRNLVPTKDRSLRALRNSKQPFAIQNEAYMVHVQSIEVTNKQGETHYTLKLTPETISTNWVFDDMSYSSNGRTASSTDIAKARIERLIGIKSDNTDQGISGQLIESAIMNPANSPIKVKAGLLQSLVEEGLQFEQVRLVLIANLLLTRTLGNIEELTFMVENGTITKVRISGYRPKVYDNMPAEHVEIQRKLHN